MFISSLAPRRFHDWLFVTTWLAIFAGLILSVVSWLEICSEECTEVHFYRFFGMKFETLGFFFFPPLLILFTLSFVWPAFSVLAALMLAGALGSEIRFILLQKYVIGHWCPVCLSIAACVFIASICYGVKYFNELNYTYKHGKREEFMKSIWKGFAGVSIVVLGFLVSLLGVTKFDQIAAAESTIKESLFFGDKSSLIEVYIFTDWACPACRAIEPQLEKMSSAIMKKAKLAFVDFAIHKETLNYSPYNVSFIIQNKDKYLALRDHLSELSKQVESPTDEQIEKLAEKEGVKYKQLNFSDIALSQKYFKQLGKQFAIDRTPTVVIINTTTKKGKKLIGGAEITEENVMKAIDSLK